MSSVSKAERPARWIPGFPLAEGQTDTNPGSASWKSAQSLKSASLEMNRGELPWGWGIYETDFFLEVCGPTQAVGGAGGFIPGAVRAILW